MIGLNSLVGKSVDINHKVGGPSPPSSDEKNIKEE